MSAQHPVELIMARGLATNLSTAVFLVDADGKLLFFNEAAGELLGVQFEEVGPMAADEWGARFSPIGEDGQPVPVAELPLTIALSGRPAYAPMRIRSGRGEHREIEVSAFPLTGRGGQTGALAIFWNRGA
ncbi:MAG TPA: PAS domain-containing protein [Solirubrobacteraceae bacterium]|jgi:PAS domain-containing protein|nr:PAS domain-containing protein [Solirubrobacteraceae bacterium]